MLQRLLGIFRKSEVLLDRAHQVSRVSMMDALMEAFGSAATSSIYYLPYYPLPTDLYVSDNLNRHQTSSLSRLEEAIPKFPHSFKSDIISKNDS